MGKFCTKKEIYHKIMELVTCILYAPERVFYTYLGDMAIDIFRRNYCGPKGCDQFAFSLLKLYERILQFRKENPNVLLKKDGSVLTLGNLIDIYNNNIDNPEYDANNYIIYGSLFTKIREMHEELFECISKEEIYFYLSQEAHVYLEQAYEMFHNNEVTRVNKGLGFNSYLEWLYYNLKEEIEGKRIFCPEKVYRFVERLKKEILLNKKGDSSLEENAKSLIEINLEQDSENQLKNVEFKDESNVFARAYAFMMQLEEICKRNIDVSTRFFLEHYIACLEEKLFKQQVIYNYELDEMEETVKNLNLIK